MSELTVLQARSMRQARSSEGSEQFVLNVNCCGNEYCTNAVSALSVRVRNNRRAHRARIINPYVRKPLATGSLRLEYCTCLSEQNPPQTSPRTDTYVCLCRSESAHEGLCLPTTDSDLHICGADLLTEHPSQLQASLPRIDERAQKNQWAL